MGKQAERQKSQERERNSRDKKKKYDNVNEECLCQPINGLNTTKEISSKLENISRETSNIEKKKGKKKKKPEKLEQITKNCGIMTKRDNTIMEIPKRDKGREEMYEKVMTEFSFRSYN